MNGSSIALQSEIPASGGRNLVVLGADVANANATANTLQDATGLSFAVNANQLYRFSFMFAYDAAATTTGIRVTLNGPTQNLLAYQSQVAVGTASITVAYMNSYNVGSVAGTSAYLTGNYGEMTGLVRPTAAGTLVFRFASEVASSAITIKAGSTAEWW